MKPDVEMYFQDPFEQFNKAFKRLMQVIQVLQSTPRNDNNETPIKREPLLYTRARLYRKKKKEARTVQWHVRAIYFV